MEHLGNQISLSDEPTKWGNFSFYLYTAHYVYNMWNHSYINIITYHHACSPRRVRCTIVHPRFAVMF